MLYIGVTATVLPASQLQMSQVATSRAKAAREGWQGGAEHDVETKSPKAMDVRIDQSLHDRHDVCHFTLTVNGVFEIRPGYDEIEQDIAGPRKLG
jgi:hypothetical protein